MQSVASDSRRAPSGRLQQKFGLPSHGAVPAIPRARLPPERPDTPNETGLHAACERHLQAKEMAAPADDGATLQLPTLMRFRSLLKEERDTPAPPRERRPESGEPAPPFPGDILRQ